MGGDVPAWVALVFSAAAGLVGWGMALARAQVSIEQAKRQAAEALAMGTGLRAEIQALCLKIELATDRLNRLGQSSSETVATYARKFNQLLRAIGDIDRRLYRMELRAGIPAHIPQELTPVAHTLEEHVPNGQRSNDM